jgi:hypothetical protein
MASDNPPDESGPGGGPYDMLRRLERRLDEASEAAERLIAEAAQSAPRRPPPAGWQAPAQDGSEPGAEGNSDLQLLAQVVQSLRDLIPPELQRRLAEALRELLLALRALIDWYLERIEHRRAEPVQVEDIPIL